MIRAAARASRIVGQDRARDRIGALAHVTSRRASVVAVGLLAMGALAWLAWSSESRAPARDRETSAPTGDARPPAPLAASGREARPATGPARREDQGATERAVRTTTGTDPAPDANAPGAGGWIEIVPVGRSSVAGMTCTASRDDGTLRDDFAFVTLTTSAEVVSTPDGRALRSKDVSGGTWTVRVRTSDRTERSWIYTGPGSASSVLVFGDSVVHGRLTDQRGERLADRTIVLRPMRRADGVRTLGPVDEVTTTTDAEGSYRFDELPAGPYHVAVGPWGADAPVGSPATADVTVAAGASARCDLRTDEVRFTLRIRHASGSVPLVGVISEPSISFDRPWVHGAAEYPARARVGVCQVFVISEGFLGTMHAGPIRVDCEGQIIELRVPGVAVEGVVLDASGRPLDLAGVEPDRRPGVDLAGGGMTRHHRGTVAVDEHGRFRLNVVPAGLMLVAAHAHQPGDVASDPRSAFVKLDVPEDRDVTGLELRLPAR